MILKVELFFNIGIIVTKERIIAKRINYNYHEHNL